MDSAFTPNYQNVIGYFTRTIVRDLRLVGGFDVLFGKVKAFVENELFEGPSVDLVDLNVLRNLSEIETVRTLVGTIKAGVNALTVRDAGTTELRGTIKLSRQTRPFLVKDQRYVTPKKSVFNKAVGDSGFEPEIAAFLDRCLDIVYEAASCGKPDGRVRGPDTLPFSGNLIPRRPSRRPIRGCGRGLPSGCRARPWRFPSRRGRRP